MFPGTTSLGGTPPSGGALNLTSNGLSSLNGTPSYVLPGTTSLTGNPGIAAGALGSYSAPQPVTNPYGTFSDNTAAQQAAQQAADSRAYYENQANVLQGQLGGLDGQQNVGLQNIDNSYNYASNRLDQQKAQAQDKYNQGTVQNQQAYGNNQNHIVQNTQSNISALQRLLGMNGAGNSSAAYEQVPYAAGLQGTQQLQDAQNTYGTNGIGLDNGWKDTLNTYKTNLDDLGNQRYSNQNSLKSTIAQQRANLLNQIAGANTNAQLASGKSYAQAIASQGGYQQQVNDLLNQITQLGSQWANPVIKTGDVAYHTPTLNEWLMNKGQGPQTTVNNNGNPGTSDVNPILAPVLAPEKRDPYGNLVKV